jgi:hypothetical protein
MRSSHIRTGHSGSSPLVVGKGAKHMPVPHRGDPVPPSRGHSLGAWPRVVVLSKARSQGTGSPSRMCGEPSKRLLKAPLFSGRRT